MQSNLIEHIIGTSLEQDTEVCKHVTLKETQLYYQPNANSQQGQGVKRLSKNKVFNELFTELCNSKEYKDYSKLYIEN